MQQPTYPCTRCGAGVPAGYPVCSACSWNHSLQPWQQQPSERKAGAWNQYVAEPWSRGGPAGKLFLVLGLCAAVGVLAWAIVASATA